MSGCGYKYHLNSGKEDFNNLKFADARDKFNTSIEKKPESYEALKMLALTLQKMKDYDGAEKAYQLAMNYPQVTLEDKFNYGTMLMSSDKHADAELVFREYLSARPADKVAKSLLESCQFIELFKEDTSRYSIKPLPLLSNLSMYSPVLFGDGLAYTAERVVEGNKENPWTGNSYNDVYFMKSGGGEWIDQKPVADIFNSVYNDGPIAFNKDEDYAVITRSYTVKAGAKRKKNEENVNNLFLYSSRLENGVWSEPKELSMNSEDYSSMHPALTSGGDTLFYSSDRGGGEGQYDLYMCTRSANDKWSAPKNLGPDINTTANEVFPVLRSDGSLYFSSNGHPSLGGLDIFRSEKIGSVWKKPRNLNYPVNSTNDDFGLTYDNSDTLGYFSSNRNGVDRVYQMIDKPRGDVMINGLVLGPDKLPMQGAAVKLIDVTTGEVLEEVLTGMDGKFEFMLEPDRNYRMESSKEGFFTESYDRSTVGQREEETEDVVFNMRDLNITDPTDPYDPNGENVYKIDNIYYNFDRYNIRADAASELDGLVKLMKDNPTIGIELHSHTDARGIDAYNSSLSELRAKSAKNYLIRRGIDSSRIVSKGLVRRESRIVAQKVLAVVMRSMKRIEEQNSLSLLSDFDKRC